MVAVVFAHGVTPPGVTEVQVEPARISSICVFPVPALAFPACLMYKELNPENVNVDAPSVEIKVGVDSVNEPGVGLIHKAARTGETTLLTLTTTKTGVPVG
ncbi:hypothetical protein D3C86_1496320 [compost metagenome]